MKQIVPVMKTGERVMFLCDASSGENVVQRIRVMMSRARKKLKAKGRRLQHFTVHHNVIPWTEGGKRHDCVIMWTSRSDSHLHNELLEDLLSNG